MLNGSYTILFIVSFVLLIVIIQGYREKIPVYYAMLFACILIANFGYMQISDATDLRTALFANQIVYLGSCFTPFFLLLCLANLCKTKINQKIQMAIVIYASIIFSLVSTIGLHDLYYKNMAVGNYCGVTYLTKEYGPLHLMYPIYTSAVFLAGFAMIVRAMRHKMDVSYVTSSLLLLIMSVVLGVYGFEKIAHFKIELLPFAYTLAQIVLLLLLRRIRLYDVSSISASSLAENKEFGFVLLKHDGRYLGCDDGAKQWFPELCDLAIDRVISEEKTDIIQQLNLWVRDPLAEQVVYIERDGIIIEAEHMLIHDRKRRQNHCVYLRDDTKQQQYTKLVESYNENLARDVDEKTAKMRQIQEDIIISMASIVENRDNNTGGHIARTSDIVKIFVRSLQRKDIYEKLTPEVAQCIIKAAPLHDFGKIGIPDIILNKPGKFTDEEYEQMKAHSAKGAVIVAQILQNSEDETFKNIAVNVAHYHHEKWDGNGYPEHIKGEEIPFEARIMALADVFDALVSKRVYKESFSYECAFSIIEESSGSHFDPVLCEEFLNCREKLIKLYDSYEKAEA